MTAEAVVLELAGLLKSGMPANQARAELRERLEQLSAVQLNQFDSLWTLAVKSGGSVSAAMQALGEVFLVTAKHRREIELAFAGPRATARLVAWLPVVGLALAQLFGLNPLLAIFTKPIASISLAIGVILLFVGRIWTKSIVETSTPSQVDPGLFFDPIRFGLSAGLPLITAVDAARDSMSKNLNQMPDEISLERLERLAAINRTSGASIADLLAAEATSQRERQRFLESERLAKLSVRLMIPLGTLTLPAFVFSTIIPVAISLLSTRQI